MSDAEETFVPEALFAASHFMALLHVEAVTVACRGFEVGADPAMRTDAKRARALLAACPRPLRPRGAPVGAVPGDLFQSTLLKDLSAAARHDDWDCLKDMAEAGWLLVSSPGDHRRAAGAGDVEPCAVLHLSGRGRAVAHALRCHLADGGSPAAFEPAPAANGGDVLDIPAHVGQNGIAAPPGGAVVSLADRREGKRRAEESRHFAEILKLISHWKR